MTTLAFPAVEATSAWTVQRCVLSRGETNKVPHADSSSVTNTKVNKIPKDHRVVVGGTAQVLAVRGQLAVEVKPSDVGTYDRERTSEGINRRVGEKPVRDVINVVITGTNRNSPKSLDQPIATEVVVAFNTITGDVDNSVAMRAIGATSQGKIRNESSDEMHAIHGDGSNIGKGPGKVKTANRSRMGTDRKIAGQTREDSIDRGVSVAGVGVVGHIRRQLLRHPELLRNT